ncbi:TIGR04282 family arsenosugar biosynthesis glycosyltransferase [Maridesulfovibrio sp.]|uniref:TIGR04282 family arsenosugar biosynthesis glycosyltransferase n=1 Tax=Maridesulfovibrio sp. TaxID=2795000 RepID=UPI0029F55787|nr:TIGR04282 family arsenosugar biosynthesis glycosyltransferase [Maridesulfovibrio sp.]
MTNCAIIVFVKFPIAGKVKTRIGNDIGFETAAELYTVFVEDMLDNLNNAGINPIIAYDPHQAEDDYCAWLGARRYMPQQGEDLGERMLNALRATFRLGFKTAILTGSDLPDLDPVVVHQAIQSIQKSPACIGPAKDGGYYLIGFQKGTLTDSVFKDMEWSTDAVFDETISRLKKRKIEPVILREHQDMDTLADLKRLTANPANVLLCPKSMALLNTFMQS